MSINNLYEGRYLMVTEHDKKIARVTDLYSYLMDNHRNEIEIHGNSLQLCTNHSLSIKQGYSGYYDFATGDKGNSIDFLTKYLGYDFASAVESLCTRSRVITKSETGFVTLKKEFVLPKQSTTNRQAIAYLEHKRGIDRALIDWLIDKGLCYQCEQIEGRERVVFTNTERNYYEVREVNGTKFCQVRGAETGYFWYFWQPIDNQVTTKPTTCYVTENAIDAISLYLLRREYAIYASIGGVGNYQRIKKAISLGLDTVIAVDNDESGKRCRDNFPECRYLIPEGKDWNEDLKRRLYE